MLFSLIFLKTQRRPLKIKFNCEVCFNLIDKNIWEILFELYHTYELKCNLSWQNYSSFSKEILLFYTHMYTIIIIIILFALWHVKISLQIFKPFLNYQKRETCRAVFAENSHTQPIFSGKLLISRKKRNLWRNLPIDDIFFCSFLFTLPDV